MVLLMTTLALSGRLILTPGLQGTQSPPGAGLTDKQLGLLNYFRYITMPNIKGAGHTTGAAAAADQGAYHWDAPWTVLPHQTGLGGLRYQLAFTAYATAELAAAQLPAYPGLARDILRDTFARLVSPAVWSYWDQPGMCGFPWTGICAKLNLSMCEFNRHGRQSDWCPDPVHYENVMYSGHLAHVGALYEMFSADRSLSTQGWAFDGPPNKRRGRSPIPYTLGKLMGAVHTQMRDSPSGGFAYLVCNQHTHTAARLFDAIAPGANYSSEKGKWLDYLNRTAVRRQPVGPVERTEGYLEILYQEQARELLGMDWFELADLGGCGGNDAWAGLALGFWVADDGATGGDLLRGVRASLAHNAGWTADAASGGAFLWQAPWPYDAQGYTTELATAWVPAALGGWGGAFPARVKEAMAFLEHAYGTPLDSDGDGVDDSYFYNTDARNGSDHHTQMWATASMAMGMARDDAIVTSLYDGSLLRRVHSQPHLDTVEPKAALVRRAVFEQRDDGTSGVLHLVLTTAGRAELRGVELTIALPPDWQRAPTMTPTDAASAGATGGADRSFSMHVDVLPDRDTPVELPFVRSV